MMMLKPPVNGPNRIPYIGARTSDSENEAPSAPIIGTVGIYLKAAYKAENTAMRAMVLVLVLVLLRGIILSFTVGIFVHCSVVFYIAY